MTSSSTDPFRRLVEQSTDGMLILDSDGRIAFANPAAQKILGHDNGLPGLMFGVPVANSPGAEVQLWSGDEPGTTVWMQAESALWQGRDAFVVTLRDESRSKAQKQEILQLSSALQTVLAIEELILRERDIQKLLHQTCSLLIQRRNYRAASAVIVDEHGGTIVVEAYDREEMSFAFVEQGASLPPCSRVGWEAAGEPLPWRPMEEDCRSCDLSELCHHRDRLLACVRSDEQVFGFITLVVAEGASGTHELELIQRLAADLGQAIQMQRTEEARQRVETELRVSEARFRQLFDNSVDAIMITDAKGCYLDANPAACEMFGYSRREILDMSVADLIVPQDQSREQDSPGQWIGKRSGTLIFMPADGTSRVADYSVFELSDVRFANVLRDVTRRRALEDQLRHAQKMQAVGRLAGGVAHDFNNSLTAILSFSNFVRDDMKPDDPRRADIDQVLRAARSAADLTRQLLAFSRQRRQSTQLVVLDRLVDELQPMLARLLGNNVEIVTRYQEGLWQVLVDPVRFEQVVVNLAVNAGDAMSGGGRLTLELANVEEHPVVGDAVALTVKDTGEGMTDEVLNHVFEPFFTTKSQGEGTGLGLSTVYGIVTQSGGHISVDSQPGRGTEFTLFFPRASVPEVDSLEPVSKPLVGGTETLLVVEDEPLVRRAAMRMLTAHGYTVHEAAGGGAALEVLNSAVEIELIVCDVVMPGMSGPEFVELARANYPDVKVIFMTGYAQNVAGFQDLVAREEIPVLHKPFEMQELLLTVRQELNG